MQNKEFEYYAFISYKREDEKWAKWLQRKIENYKLPAKLYRENPQLPQKLIVFKDTTDIKSGVLEDELKQNLRQSQNLIVVCSPLSAKSPWVGKEIDYFIQSGRQNRIFLFIIDGVPYSQDPSLESIHQIIKDNLPEMLGANIHEQGKGCRFIKREKAFIRMLSPMLGVSFDALWDRQKRRLINQITTTTLLALCFVASLVVVWSTNQPFDAQITLLEKTTHHPKVEMPPSGGIITIHLDNQQLSDTIFDRAHHFVFPNLPAKYLDKPVALTFFQPGFHKIDTTMTLHKKTSLSISRDQEYYGRLKGVVRSAATDAFITKAVVHIASQSAVTDHNGYFEMTIPLPEQLDKYPATILYNGREYQTPDIIPCQDNDKITNTIYLK